MANDGFKIGDRVKVTEGFSWRGTYEIIRFTKLGSVPAAVIFTGETYARTFVLESLRKV